MSEKRYERCLDCAGSWHIFIPQPDGAVLYVKHCLRCRRTGRVEVEADNAPEPTEADRRRREFYTGDNT